MVCCAYAREVHGAVVIRQAENMTCLRCAVSVLRQRWATFSEYFTEKGASHTKQCWCQKTRRIALSCCIKISAVHHLVLSQYTPDKRTDGQNSDSNIVHCITCSRMVKMLVTTCLVSKRIIKVKCYEQRQETVH